MKPSALPAWIAALVLVTAFGAPGLAKPLPGHEAPQFVLKDLKGQIFDLRSAEELPLLVLWFFDVDSRPSQEGLVTLDRLAKTFPPGALAVWGITTSPAAAAAQSAAAAGLSFPILLDEGAVSERYGAEIVLPTACVLGPGRRVLDRFEGGGKTTEAMLVRLAERKLQQRAPAVALAIGDAVARENPAHPGAKAVRGNAALAQKDLPEAERVFRELAATGGDAEVLGKEGLAAVHARRGEPDKALALAAEVEKKAPGRAPAHVVKADVLLARGETAQAEAEYRKAAAAPVAPPSQAARASNQLGRLAAGRGEYERARELYEKAELLNPFDVETTTNKGLTYEKEGRWDQALETYRRALAVDATDPFAATLARRAQELVELQKDAERSRRVDQLVKELSARFRSREKAPPTRDDPWTSGPMVLTFVDVQEKGGLADRDGFSAVLLTQLTEQLGASGRVQVVERALLARLLEELNLGSSELADPETALRLGRLFAARLIGTGTLLHGPQESLLSLRLIDTETSAVAKVWTRTLGTAAALEREVLALNREILGTVIRQYPLQGYVVRAEGDRVLLNIGSSQGVVPGTEFDLVEEGEPVEYRGKLLQGEIRSVGRVRVARVEPGLSHAEALPGERAPRPDDRIRERFPGEDRR
ncbi:MAG: tetratricopeptide repeat protein [Thermodesulfobacteriota bacterium]